MNQALILNQKKPKSACASKFGLQQEIEDSYNSILAKNYAELNTESIMPSLLKVLINQSLVYDFNYLSLVEKYPNLNEFFSIEKSEFGEHFIFHDFFSNWIEKYDIDGVTKVFDLKKKYYDGFGVLSIDVPDEYLLENVCKRQNEEICLVAKDIIKVGQDCDYGIIIPEEFGSIMFHELYNCVPLISKIKSDRNYLSFLHVWAERGDPYIVDLQVKHWMNKISEIGEVTESFFAPRKNSYMVADTHYLDAVADIEKISKKTLVYNRTVSPLNGITNKNGIFLDGCGYHLWNST